MGMGMGMGTAAAGAENPPPPPPPPPPDFLSLSTSIRSASSPGDTSGCQTEAGEWMSSHLLTAAADAHPDHGVRLVGHVVILGYLYQVALHQDLGRGLHAQFVHQLQT